ncbi:polysaccharide biosynthesis protein [Marinilabiliaceae bacterium JC017]|nr:polysaccharide biosynthesis protein [Marinilabiliaceae bacterium JC017]
MKNYLLNVIKSRVVSPFWILVIDLGIVANAFLVAFILWLSFQDSAYSVWGLIGTGTWVLFVYLLTYLGIGSYRGVIRHSNYNEFKMLIIACFIAFAVLVFVDLVVIYYELPWSRIPLMLLVFHFLLTTILSFVFRMIVKETYAYLTKKKANINTLIYGAGDMGQITLEAIRNDKDNRFNVVGFVDDNPSKWNLNLHSITVQSWEKAIKIWKVMGVKVIILAINNISVNRKKEITKDCLDNGWKLKVMPTVGNWVNGISNRNQIRDIRIEDILGRKEIQLNLKRISSGLERKIVLVTGAAGSIGSEIVRQLLRFPIKKILLVDIAESALYDLQQELLLSYYDVPFEIILADYTNAFRMRQVFESYRPHIVYNAAAFKHVPLMEANPYEAIRVNIGGSKVIADISVEFGVEKFVMVSTDKAVNPTNVMGASKRICEIYIQSLSNKRNVRTSFITTRFGNVLGSNGSVVPLFKKQISQGGPVTVTHPEITRFFMTIPEASQLVLEAGFMGKGGEVFVFDMGEPVKIIDLATEMIQLAGLKLGEDIDIKYSGLRPGEKLYEELLASKENKLSTHHEKIMIAEVRMYEYEEVNRIIKQLLSSLNIEDNFSLVARMKDLVPEFVSNNSGFSVLDKTN